MAHHHQAYSKPGKNDAEKELLDSLEVDECILNNVLSPNAAALSCLIWWFITRHHLRVTV